MLQEQATGAGPSAIPFENYSDSSEDEVRSFPRCFFALSHLSQLENRIGNVPTEWYNEYDHIGYNVEGTFCCSQSRFIIINNISLSHFSLGQKIARKTKKGDRLDAFLDAHDKSKRWTFYDPVEDKGMVCISFDVITPSIACSAAPFHLMCIVTVAATATTITTYTTTPTCYYYC